MSYYLGPSPVDNLASTQRYTQKFTGNGTQTLYYLYQQVPGAYENNIIVLVNNIVQESESSYLIEDAFQIKGSITGTFTEGETVTGGTSGATATVTNITAEYIFVAESTDSFQVGETVTGVTSSATISVSEYTQFYGHTLKFLEAPENLDDIIAVHLGSSTYQLQPSARSVGPKELQDNLREFSVDTFDVTTSGTTDFTLSREVVSDNSVLVTLDGVVQNGLDNYGITGTTLTFTEPVPIDVNVRVLYLGFTTSARRSVIDGAITNRKIAQDFTPVQSTFPTPIRVGQEVYRDDLDAFFKWNGTTWIEI